MALISQRRYLAAAPIVVVAYLGPQWFTPSGHGLREFRHAWWQTLLCALLAAGGVYYLTLMTRHRKPTTPAPPEIDTAADVPVLTATAVGTAS